MSDSRHENLNNVDTSVWRILDVNCNRATEASRVIEEYCRFQGNSESLAKHAKQLRHEISSAMQSLVGQLGVSRLVYRDTENDVGTQISTNDEYHRESVDQLLFANFSRLQQSLRTMEEYAKTVESSPVVLVAAKAFEKARYESYTLQKILLHQDRGRNALSNCALCVLTDGAADENAFAERIEMLVGTGSGIGVDMIQLRDKQLDSRDLLDRARIARRLTAAANKLLIINDRPDICQLAAADGLHVGQSDFSVAEARSIVGEKLVGVSTHSVDDARTAVRDGADYIGVGPMFESSTKQFSELKGCELLIEVSAEIDLPAFAIGGIDVSNVEAIVAAGGHRVAISGGILNASDPVKAIGAIHSCLAETVVRVDSQ